MRGNLLCFESEKVSSLNNLIVSPLDLTDYLLSRLSGRKYTLSLNKSNLRAPFKKVALDADSETNATLWEKSISQHILYANQSFG